MFGSLFLSFIHSFIKATFKWYLNKHSCEISIPFFFILRTFFGCDDWRWKRKEKKKFLIFMWKRVHVKAASSIIVVVKSLKGWGKILAKKKNFLVHQLKQYCRFLLIITRVAHSHSLSTSSNEIQLMHPHMNEVTYRVVFPLYYFIFLRPYTRRFLWLC